MSIHHIRLSISVLVALISDSYSVLMCIDCVTFSHLHFLASLKDSALLVCITDIYFYFAETAWI